MTADGFRKLNKVAAGAEHNFETSKDKVKVEDGPSHPQSLPPRLEAADSLLLPSRRCRCLSGREGRAFMHLVSGRAG